MGPPFPDHKISKLGTTCWTYQVREKVCYANGAGDEEILLEKKPSLSLGFLAVVRSARGVHGILDVGAIVGWRSLELAILALVRLNVQGHV